MFDWHLSKIFQRSRRSIADRDVYVVQIARGSDAAPQDADLLQNDGAKCRANYAARGAAESADATGRRPRESWPKERKKKKKGGLA